MKNFNQFVKENDENGPSEEGGLVKSAHIGLGLKPGRLVVSGESVARYTEKLLEIIMKNDKDAKVEFYPKTGKIVGIIAVAKLPGIKRDMKIIDQKIVAEIKNLKL